VLQNDSLPFFNLEPGPQWKYQNNFDTPDVKQATTNGGTQLLPDHAKAQKLEPGELGRFFKSFLILILNPDMNDPKVLELYMELALFRRDLFSEELLFWNPDHSLQYLIHSLARKLDLEYVFFYCPF
jgi:hypothetical protein